MLNKQADRALKAGKLAISAESLGNQEEVNVAAVTCGRLFKVAGLDMEAVWQTLRPEGIETAYLTWNYVVDGFYA